MSAKPILEQVPRRQDESFDCEIIQGPDYGTRWHFHPEVQITLAVRSKGYRIVGDNIAPLGDGDLVLIGSEVPHVWQQDDASGGAVHAMVLRFREDFLGREFLALPEMGRITRLLQRARRGLEVSGRVRREVTERLLELPGATGMTRVLILLGALDLLSRSAELRPLASAGFRPQLDASDQERMGRILRHIQDHLTEEIARDDVARVASLSAGAFSRYFRSRTGKTLPEYVNELRIGRSCRFLAETDAPITEIALDCGFLNLANFNRWFRKVTGTVPRDYRSTFGRSR